MGSGYKLLKTRISTEAVIESLLIAGILMYQKLMSINTKEFARIRQVPSLLEYYVLRQETTELYHV